MVAIVYYYAGASYRQTWYTIIVYIIILHYAKWFIVYVCKHAQTEFKIHRQLLLMCCI